MKKYSLNSGNSPIVSLLANCYAKRGKDIQLFEIIRRIKSDEFKGLIAKIRSAPNKKERDKLKLKLPAFIVTGSLAGKLRARNPMEPRSGYVCIDLDKLSGIDFHSGGISSEAQDVKDALGNDPFCIVVFISPSGDGVKGVFKSSNWNHLASLFDYVEKLTGYRPDEPCKDVNRLCFFSHDSEIFVNPIAEDFSESDFAKEIYSSYRELDSFPSEAAEPEPPEQQQTSDQSQRSEGEEEKRYLSVCLCDKRLLCVTNEESKSAVAPTRSSLDAKREFVKTRKNLVKFYVNWIEQVFTPKQGCRNTDSIKMMTFLFHACCEDVALLFANQYYRRNQHLWDALLGEHMSEARAHLKALTRSYPESLNPDELGFYLPASKQVQDGFRICRDLGSRENAKNGEPCFFLAQNELAFRVGFEEVNGVKPSKQGSRLLEHLIKAGLLKIEKKGQSGNPRLKKLLATEYRWLGSLTDSNIYSKENNK